MNSITNTDQEKLNKNELDRKTDEIIERLNNVQHMIEFCEKEVGKICILGADLGLPENLLESYKKSLKSFNTNMYDMFDWVCGQ